MNHELFKDVLNQIHNVDIVKFTIECLKAVDPALETIPTSASGKYHPKECNEKGGLVKHILRTCYFANILFLSQKWEADNIKGDLVLSALLLHDIGKKEKYESNKGWEYVNHPITAATLMKQFQKLIPEQYFKIITNCVLYHMGPWTPSKIKKEMNAYTMLELFTYQCDFLASRKDLEIVK